MMYIYIIIKYKKLQSLLLAFSENTPYNNKKLFDTKYSVSIIPSHSPKTLFIPVLSS